MRIGAAGALLAGALWPVAAGATVTLEIPVELEADVVHEDGVPDSRELFTKIEPDLRVETGALAFNVGLTLEPVAERGGRDRIFEGEGLFVRALNVEWTTGPLTLTAGKFAAPFSFGFEAVPGIFGDALIEDLELAERLGVMASVSFRDGGAAYSIHAAAFRVDTTLLARSILTGRGAIDGDDGGFGNTHGLGNMSVALEATDPLGLEGLHLGAGWLFQENPGGAEDQRAVVLDAGYALALGGDRELSALAEFFRSEGATFSGIDQLGDGHQRIATLGLAYAGGPWTLALVHGWAETEPEAGLGEHERTGFVQASAGYTWNTPWGALGMEAGYLAGRTRTGEGEASDRVAKRSAGLLFTYTLSFGDAAQEAACRLAHCPPGAPGITLARGF
jgi:hypothetical protein